MLSGVRWPVIRRWLAWFSALLVIGVAMLAVRARLDKAHVTLAFLLIVLLGSSAGGRALGIALAAGAFLAFNWFFLPPYNTLVIANPLDWLVLIAFLVTGVVAAQLLERERRQAELAGQRADEIDRIATLGAENLNAPRAEDALDAIATVIRDAMRTDACLVFLKQDDEFGVDRLPFLAQFLHPQPAAAENLTLVRVAAIDRAALTRFGVDAPLAARLFQLFD